MEVGTRYNSAYDMNKSELASKEDITQVFTGDRVYRHLVYLLKNLQYL